MKKSDLVRKKYELTCLSPVHIGNGEKLKAYEYIYDRTGQEVYFISEEKWISFLAENGLMDDFASYVERTAEGMRAKELFKGDNLWEWLSCKGFEDSEIRGLGNRCAKAVTNASEINKGTLNDLLCHITLADGRPYIPGSALKGVLRTGILHGLMRRYGKASYEKQWNDIFNARLMLNARQRERVWNDASKQLETSLLKKMSFFDQTGREKRVIDSGRDVMRGFSVSDAMPYDENLETVILQKICARTSASKMGKFENALPIFFECIPSGVKFVFDVVIDRSFMGEVGILSMDEIIGMTREYINIGLQYQKDVFGEKYNDEFKIAQNADLIIGGGTGFWTKSLIYTIAPSRKEGCSVVSGYLNDSFPRHRHKFLDKDISPRTMKLTRTQHSRSFMGLCSLREISLC